MTNEPDAPAGFWWRKPKFSLWALFVFVSLFALIGAAVRAELRGIVICSLIVCLLVGFLSFGYVIYRVLDALVTRNLVKWNRFAGMALDAMLGAGLIYCIISAGSWIYAAATHGDRSQIDERYQTLREGLIARDYYQAYSVTSPKYRKLRTLDQFKQEMTTGLILRLDPGRTLKLRGNRAILVPTDRFSSARSYSPAIHWERIGDQWYFTGEVH
jgi:hypothetical protein